MHARNTRKQYAMQAVTVRIPHFAFRILLSTFRIPHFTDVRFTLANNFLSTSKSNSSKLYSLLVNLHEASMRNFA